MHVIEFIVNSSSVHMFHFFNNVILNQKWTFGWNDRLLSSFSLIKPRPFLQFSASSHSDLNSDLHPIDNWCKESPFYIFTFFFILFWYSISKYGRKYLALFRFHCNFNKQLQQSTLSEMSLQVLCRNKKDMLKHVDKVRALSYKNNKNSNTVKMERLHHYKQNSSCKKPKDCKWQYPFIRDMLWDHILNFLEHTIEHLRNLQKRHICSVSTWLKSC